MKRAALLLMVLVVSGCAFGTVNPPPNVFIDVGQYSRHDPAAQVPTTTTRESVILHAPAPQSFASPQPVFDPSNMQPAGPHSLLEPNATFLDQPPEQAEPEPEPQDTPPENLPLTQEADEVTSDPPQVAAVVPPPFRRSIEFERPATNNTSPDWQSLPPNPAQPKAEESLDPVEEPQAEPDAAPPAPSHSFPWGPALALAAVGGSWIYRQYAPQLSALFNRFSKGTPHAAPAAPQAGPAAATAAAPPNVNPVGG